MSLKSTAFAAITSFIVCGAVLATRHWHGRFTVDGHSGVQRFHDVPTPRVGGVGIFLGVWIGWLLATEALLGWALLSSFPAFLAGFMEDITKRVSVRVRLAATILSGVMAFVLTGYGVDRLDIPWVDAMLHWMPLCGLFTAVAVAGVANAYNIIDGFNGLTAAAMMVALAALGVIAYEVGDIELFYFALLCMGAVAGFMAWNYPLGRIFLGDGGAYAMGFLIAWLAVALPARHPEVSPWASLLACGYPVMETTYSMIRRRMARAKTGEPDALHLHSLVKKVIIGPTFHQIQLVLRNAMVMLTLLPFISLVAVTGVMFYRDSLVLMAAFAGFFVMYVVTHTTLIRSKYAHDQVGRDVIDSFE